MIDRRTVLSGTAAAIALSGVSPLWAQTSGAAGESAALKVASVKFGAVNWLLETIKAEGIDTKLGLAISPVELSNNQAGAISLLSGGSDIIASDWTWALRQRGLGEPLKFAPYSSTLGGVLVPPDSTIKTLADLTGRRIGVAGSSIDKSWLLLQAYTRKKLDFDLASKATVQFGAAPLLSEQLRNGSLDAVLNFWTQNVRLSTLGFREIMSMREVMRQLDIDPVPAFVGFIWKEQTEITKRAQVMKFLAAAELANTILAKSDAAWERLKPLMKATNETEFAALKAAYLSGVPTPWREADTASASKIMQLLIDAGDTEFVGAKTIFDPKLFHVANA